MDTSWHTPLFQLKVVDTILLLLVTPLKEFHSKCLLSEDYECGDDDFDDNDDGDFDHGEDDVDDEDDDDVVHPPLSVSRLTLSFVHSADWLSYNITNQLGVRFYQ